LKQRRYLLDMLIALHPPNLGQQGLTLNSLEVRVGQPISLGLDGSSAYRTEGATR
jgi:hypothetical protein